MWTRKQITLSDHNAIQFCDIDQIIRPPYLFEQHIKWGVFVGGADVRQVDETMGKAQVAICQQAIPGTCSNQ